MLCVNTHYLNQHLAMIDRQDAKAELISNRVAELTCKGGEFYPLDKESIFEALGDMGKDRETILQYMLEHGATDKPELLAGIGQLLLNWITDYWNNQAEKKALKELKGNRL